MTKARAIHRIIPLVLLAIGTMMVAGLLPFHAFAADVSSDLQDETAGVAVQLVSLPKLFAFLAYVIGTGFAVRSLFALKGFIEAPDDNPVNRFIGFATVSALLIMLPYSLGVTNNTLGMSGETSVQSSATSFKNAATCTADGTIGAVFCNLVIQFSPFASFLAVISYVMAAALTMTGLLNLKAHGDDPSQMPLRSIIMKFVLATMLISLPLAMQIFVTSVTGVDSIDTTAKIKKQPSLYNGSVNN